MNVTQRKVRINLVILLSVIATVFLARALSPQTLQISSSGEINASGRLGVFSDAACTQNLNAINWGNLAKGSSTNHEIFIKNVGTTPVMLSLSTDAWNPSLASIYVGLSWNYAPGAEIQPEASIPVILTLTISPAVNGFTSFRFTIDITPNG